MFTVVDKETGQTHVVYGINGLSFLIYDDTIDDWAYKDMNCCRPYKLEEVQHGN